MLSLRKIGLWTAVAISIPGAAFALLVAIPRIPVALMFGLDSFRIPTLYLLYFSGITAGVLCVRALIDGVYVPETNYGLRAIIAALGFLAAAYLEYYFRNDRFPLIPGGYLAFTSIIWMFASLTAWRKGQRASVVTI